MEIYKGSERVLHIDSMLSALKETIDGFESKQIGEWCKWEELTCGGKLQVKMTIYECKCNGKNIYTMADGLGRVAMTFSEDKAGIITWLKDHGYKRDKQWYLEDYGMSEETWNAWNSITEE